jgi:hypothetical protein
MLLSELLPSLQSETDWSDCLQELAGHDILDAGSLLLYHASLDDQLARARDLVQSYLECEGQTAAQLRDAEAARGVHLATTTSEALDALLGGGWCPGEIVEVAGNKGAGKSMVRAVLVPWAAYNFAPRSLSSRF